jgi:DNA polymerase III subunit delta'
MTIVWDDVVGQADAVTQLRRAAEHPVHAYLFVGPPGSTKSQAARAFGALLLTGSDAGGTRDARLVLAGEHPDVREVERVGARIDKDQAREIVRLSSLAPVEGERKLMVLHDFHLVAPEGAAVLLKTIEEPPASTIFVVLADFVPADLITIASRCVRIDFRSIPDVTIADRLVAEGSDPDTAAEAASAAGGDLVRARLLAADPALTARRRAFAETPGRLDGFGATVMTLVDELIALIDEAAAPLAERHNDEVAALDARIAQFGERGSGRKQLEERHKREIRRHRTDELRAGLGAMAATYRDALVRGEAPRPDAAADAVSRIHHTLAVLERNPNEALALQTLVWSLPPLPAATNR